MVMDYKKFLDNIDRKAYREGEWQWQEGEYTVTRTYNYTAPGCHNSCGVLLYTKDGKLEKVEGDPLDPYANGKLCMRCLALDEMVNSPLRLKYPMKRVGKRGENKWERITWDEALDIVEAEVKKLDAEGYGRESIVVGHGTGRNINWQIPFLAGACFGTANCGGIYFSGWSCYMPRVCGAAGPLGDYPIVDASETLPDRYANSEWKNPDVLVVWGNEPLKSNADGFLGHWLNLCVQRGTKIISIDPVLTWWGARAEYWLPINSGTDVCLALAWLNVIMNEDLIDHEFVEEWVLFYDELKEHVQQFTPEWAAERTGLAVEDIVGSARLYASADAGAIQWGLAFDASTASSMHLVQAVCALMAICGNIEKPGTHVLVHNAFEINAGYSTADLYARESARKNKFSKKLAGFEGLDFVGMSNPDAMALSLETGKPYPIRIFWAQSCNQICGHEEPAPRAYKYLKNVPFIVYADPFLTPSAVAFADLVLPVAMSCERNSARTWWTPLRAMKKVSSYYEAKTDEEIILWLGKRLNPELFKNWNTPEDLINSYMKTSLALVDESGRVKKANFSAATDESSGHNKDITGDVNTLCPVSFEELVEMGGHLYDEWNATYYKHEKGMLRPDGQPGFNTATGKIELIPSIFVEWGIPPYPVYTPVSVSKDTTPELFKEYPFYFINGTRSYEFFHTEHRQSPTMREFHPEPIVMVSPETAEEYDLRNGDWIWIENQDGRCKQMVKIFPGMDKRFIVAEHGWWKPEEEIAEPHLCGAFDYNPNNLTHAYESGPGNIGAPIKCLICKIYKCKEGDTSPGEQVTRLGGFRDYEPGKM
ncbi:MAG: molybdopterin-dependent oxidoreductase [Peptococcaceae bacterium]|jgi:anaerobic selenocysteine-containing dehydrogenase|nr:molybdopterin-dependent oxidoreductase [Peptococcaceae bacterium]